MWTDSYSTRYVEYTFVYRDTRNYFEGQGRVAMSYGVSDDEIDKKIREHLRETGYCTDHLTGKRFRWYYCKIERVK